MSKAVNEWEDRSNALWDIAELDTVDLCDGLDWDRASNALIALSTDRNGANLAADLLKYRATVAARQLSPFADAATIGEVPPGTLDDMYELVAIAAVVRSYLGSDGQELGRLGSLALDDARRSFKRVDKDLHKLEAAAIVAQRLKDKAPSGVGYGP